MKKITAIFFLLVIAAQVFNKGLVMADYLVNKKYIAEVLCENRDKPMMHCNGKCHLRRQLQKEEDHQKKEGQTSTEKFEVQFCEAAATYYQPVYADESVVNHNTVYNNQYRFTAISAFFHPPSA